MLHKGSCGIGVALGTLRPCSLRLCTLGLCSLRLVAMWLVSALGDTSRFLLGDGTMLVVGGIFETLLFEACVVFGRVFAFEVS
jgi:hypothetical protein